MSTERVRGLESGSEVNVWLKREDPAKILPEEASRASQDKKLLVSF